MEIQTLSLFSEVMHQLFKTDMYIYIYITMLKYIRFAIIMSGNILDSQCLCPGKKHTGFCWKGNFV